MVQKHQHVKPWLHFFFTIKRAISVFDCFELQLASDLTVTFPLFVVLFWQGQYISFKSLYAFIVKSILSLNIHDA